MSCQQASRFIAVNNNSTTTAAAINVSNNNRSSPNSIKRIVATDDPYVFTETVPTTPPILFNAQARPRLNEIIGGSNTSAIGFTNTNVIQPQQQQKITSTQQTNGKLATIKTQASLETASSSATSSSSPSCVAPTLKHVTTQSLAASAAAIQNKKVTNVCVVRPQLQQQQQHVISSSCSSIEGELKSISPPPLYTPPTPSLWQTPLLIETPPQTTVNQSPPASTLPPPSMTYGGNGLAAGQNLGSTTLSSMSGTTPTAMAKVAPIVVHSPPSPAPPSSSSMTPVSLTSCLPPSKFHNTTLAQHLQKVECLKKPKKSVQPMAPPVPSHFYDDLKARELVKNCIDPTILDNDDNATKSSCKHSDGEELNEIPVNVIFRMALVPQQQQQQHQEIKSPKPTNGKIIATIPANKTISLSRADLLPQTKSNVIRRVTAKTIPALKTNLHNGQQINTSSFKQQQQRPSLAKPCLANGQTRVGDPTNESENSEFVSPSKGFRAIKDDTVQVKIKNSCGKSLATSCRKYNSNRSSNDSLVNTCASTSKGAVAVVRLSHHHEDEESSVDLSYLASPITLPYCLQNYWFNSYEWRKPLASADKVLNRTAMREERIASYKQQLSRQAMQLLSTRSLQKLPFHAARRRLICVDRLLRKYYKQNEKGLPANVKRCCFNGCDGISMEMASHCPKHIILSAGKEIFLPCTAKFADNTQCRVPVFDITHDLPLCLEHARKRDAYNRLVYDQKPRKILNVASAASSIFKVEGGAKKQRIPPSTYKRGMAIASNQQQQLSRKRKSGTGNPVGRPLKRPKKLLLLEQTSSNTPKAMSSTATHLQSLSLSSTGLKRNGSTTSLESIASNSQHSLASSPSTSQQQNQQPQFYATITNNSTSTNASAINAGGQTTLPPPALAPLSTGFMANNSLPQHLFSFGHDYNDQINKHSSSNISPTTEFKDFISNLTFAPQKTSSTLSASSSTSIKPTVESTDANSNSNFTSSGMGSTTSLPTADDFLTQDMLSICENSSASSVDTGLGGLSDPELMLGGPDGDDMPLGDTHLLEEHDLANVLNSLPEDAFKELFATVHQDESDEIERAIELADKHLKTLQQTIGSELGDFLDFSDDMLMDNNDMCNATGTAGPNGIIDNSISLFNGSAMASVNSAGVTATSNDTRGLVQT
ncbi:zf-C3Hc3H domain-containing lethal (3) L1231 isoform X2 [Haematobia irritans]|uniref:zf-C3Hc3H domain-containing lethal (3) L1231 isoform X2 n=1 Tax=Haematobia irritans TaxID=7368 RepID=UPI003F4F89F6